MFEASLVESTPLLQPRSRWPAMLSFGLQAVIVFALILIPLVNPEILPFAIPKLQVFAPRFMPPRQPPSRAPSVRGHTMTTVVAPTLAPVLAMRSFQTDARPVYLPVLAVGLNLGAQGSSPFSALVSSHITGGRVWVAGPPAANAKTGPLRISGGVLSGMLLAPIRPEYPAIARISRTEGSVVVDALISTAGRIESAHVVSGPPMLQASALQAVRDARYRPFLLNGKPTEVSTTITINFRLGS
jgi:protein TonB